MYFRAISRSLSSSLASLCSKFYPGNILPVVKLFACLGVFAYQTSNENPNFSRHLFKHFVWRLTSMFVMVALFSKRVGMMVLVDLDGVAFQ